MALAPERFAAWMSTHVARDLKFGRAVFRYHPRSDEHSKTLCRLFLEDLMAECPLVAGHVRAGQVVCGINTKFQFPNGKRKTLDLAIGAPAVPAPGGAGSLISNVPLATVRLACEAKQTMTEHIKSKPRLFDELSSSHEIVHQGDPKAISAGIVVVNIATQYASPTRQTSGEGPLVMTAHRQPDVCRQVVEHLRGLKVREAVGEVGFDAYATIVVDCDNVGPCALHTSPPAPQPGAPDHYQTFLERISRAYQQRFG
jgi:hypothetical protein